MHSFKANIHFTCVLVCPLFSAVYHSLYHTSCCRPSQWPSQWNKANFDTPWLRNPWVQFTWYKIDQTPRYL